MLDKTELFQLIRRKGVYPYEYMDSWERFNEAKLPPLRHFLSKLSKEVETPGQLSDKESGYDPGCPPCSLCVQE
eukprot:49583-Eustigmatos_ZCMA.PRE.1